MNNHFDTLETRDRQERETALLAALPGQVAHAKNSSASFARILKAFDAAEVTSRKVLATLPVIRKHELLGLQQASRAAGGNVFGGFSAIDFGAPMPQIGR